MTIEDVKKLRNNLAAYREDRAASTCEDPLCDYCQTVPALDLAISLYEENEELKATVNDKKHSDYAISLAEEKQIVAEAKAEERDRLISDLELQVTSRLGPHEAAVVVDILRKRGGGE